MESPIKGNLRPRTILNIIGVVDISAIKVVRIE